MTITDSRDGNHKGVGVNAGLFGTDIDLTQTAAFSPPPHNPQQQHSNDYYSTKGVSKVPDSSDYNPKGVGISNTNAGIAMPQTAAFSPPQHSRDRGVQTLSHTFPLTVTFTLTDDLPNGPYGDPSATGLKMYYPMSKRITYSEAKEYLIQAWKETRGSSMPAQFQRVQYQEEWTVGEIKFKGGVVMDSEIVREGDHTVSFGLIQKLGLQASAKVECCVIQ